MMAVCREEKEREKKVMERKDKLLGQTFESKNSRSFKKRKQKTVVYQSKE